MWTDHFDKILLINLPKRTNRLAAASSELMKYSIPFEIVSGIDQGNGSPEPGNGEYGIWLTLKQIFSNAISAKFQRILIFEDDVQFVEDPNYYMPWMIEQLEERVGWEIFYLGPNTHKPLNKVSPNILLADRCRGLHAVAYSYDGMLSALQNMKFFYHAIDMVFESRLQPKQTCYTSYPMIATQSNGYSDILQKEVNNNYIENRFKENTKHLLL